MYTLMFFVTIVLLALLQVTVARPSELQDENSSLVPISLLPRATTAKLPPIVNTTSNPKLASDIVPRITLAPVKKEIDSNAKPAESSDGSKTATDATPIEVTLNVDNDPVNNGGFLSNTRLPSRTTGRHEYWGSTQPLDTTSGIPSARTKSARQITLSKVTIPPPSKTTSQSEESTHPATFSA